MAAEQNTIPIKPYSIKELEKMYDVDRRTLLKWFEPFKIKLGERIGHRYTPKQIKIIFEEIEFPLKKI